MPYPAAQRRIADRLPGDALARQRDDYRERPDPHFRTHGPRTRREFLNLLAWNGGERA